MGDNVNHPKHYTSHPSGIEAIEVTQHYNFCVGNALKYLWRAGLKGDAVEDLKKAVWYIQREIDNREKGVYNGKSGQGKNEGVAEKRYGSQLPLQLDGLNQSSFTTSGGTISAQPYNFSIAGGEGRSTPGGFGATASWKLGGEQPFRYYIDGKELDYRTFNLS
jgi:hypothetical protein